MLFALLCLGVSEHQCPKRIHKLQPIWRLGDVKYNIKIFLVNVSAYFFGMCLGRQLWAYCCACSAPHPVRTDCRRFCRRNHRLDHTSGHRTRCRRTPLCSLRSLYIACLQDREPQHRDLLLKYRQYIHIIAQFKGWQKHMLFRIKSTAAEFIMIKHNDTKKTLMKNLKSLMKSITVIVQLDNYYRYALLLPISSHLMT